VNRLMEFSYFLFWVFCLLTRNITIYKVKNPDLWEYCFLIEIRIRAIRASKDLQGLVV